MEYMLAYNQFYGRILDTVLVKADCADRLTHFIKYK
jgi:hypothetical protein